MTKRKSPYETNVSRQFKIHVSNYENDINALKEIEELTMKKLVNGSKKVHSGELSNLNEEIVENINFKTTHNFNKKFLQKCVTNYFTVNGQLYENDKCNVIPFSNTSKKCSFCEIRTTSLEQCIQCLEFYCNSCSFIRYEFSLNENRICMSCMS